MSSAIVCRRHTVLKNKEILCFLNLGCSCTPKAVTPIFTEIRSILDCLRECSQNLWLQHWKTRM